LADLVEVVHIYAILIIGYITSKGKHTIFVLLAVQFADNETGFADVYICIMLE